MDLSSLSEEVWAVGGDAKTSSSLERSAAADASKVGPENDKVSVDDQKS